MKVADKFTFKTNKPTGKYRSFDTDYHHIKLAGREVGNISAGKTFRINLNVMKTETITDSNPNCPWKRITLKKESETLQEAKDWLNANFKSITAKYTIAQK